MKLLIMKSRNENKKNFYKFLVIKNKMKIKNNIIRMYSSVGRASHLIRREGRGFDSHCVRNLFLFFYFTYQINNYPFNFLYY